jgi:hypothetical protein
MTVFFAIENGCFFFFFFFFFFFLESSQFLLPCAPLSLDPSAMILPKLFISRSLLLVFGEYHYRARIFRKVWVLRFVFILECGSIPTNPILLPTAEFQWLWDILSEDNGLRKRKLHEFFDGANGKRLDTASLCTFIQALSTGTSTSFVKPYDDNKAQLIRLIVHQVDMDDDGKISWQEFKQATRMLAPSPHVAIPPPARLLRVVRDHYDDIYVTFVSTDDEGTGMIEMDEFKSVLKTLVEVKKIEPIIEDDEMEALFYYLCTSPTQQSIMWRDVLNAASIIAADN